MAVKDKHTVKRGAHTSQSRERRDRRLETHTDSMRVGLKSKLCEKYQKQNKMSGLLLITFITKEKK